MSAGLPLTADGEDIAQAAVPDITPTSLMAQQQTSSSAGLLPLFTLFGSPSGSKKEMQASAVMLNEKVLAFGTMPDSQPLKPSVKPEAIKNRKSPGLIQLVPGQLHDSQACLR
ncbi:hypothetical protein HPB48_009169 [Haemaphysalis longicornis]|uniref:Uncharacterized protein n=1 Tax=Haemaphysalis longicornis TaxID=44386 RepID=A0A9J6GIL8_HAELO|nr:hypothetical protein HPB48_009169 [Haemaphysalis longicornis]